MTNSHSRATQKEGRNSERNNASPNHQKNASQNGGNGRKVTFFNDNNKGNTNNSNNNNNSNSNKGYYAQKHSSSAPQQYFSTSPKDIVTPPNHQKNRHHQQRNHHNGSPHGLMGRSPPRSPISFASPAGVSTTTPNLHFAGSKYFDAPSPNALPRPPCHWTSSSLSSSSSSSSSPSSSPPFSSTLHQTVESATPKRRLFPIDISNQKCSLMAAEAASKNLCSDIFSHNLKLLLNVQA